jgi:predicted nuclease of predicted toxin-antitoxin system
MKLVVDMNLPPRWVGFLAANSVDAVHWSTVGDPRASDAVIMNWALDNDCYVFTHDLDFTAILALAGATGPSIIQVRTQNVLPEAIGVDVVRVLSTHADAIQAGAIVTIDEVGARVRVLPIRRVEPAHQS